MNTPQQGIEPGGTVKVWEDVYASFQDSAKDVVGRGHGGSAWLTRSTANAHECFAALNAGRPIPPFYKQRIVLLPPVAAMMLEHRDCLRILDFGGGMGIGYLTLSESIPTAAERIHYTIVELPETCDEGRRMFGNTISYLTALPQAKAAFDLVHSSSTLQYVEDWQGALVSLGSYGAEYMLLSDVYAGRIPTFVTLQRDYDSRMRHWFWNLDEFRDACAQAGYRFVMTTFATGRILGVEGPLPMDHFPDTHRLERSLQILLRRTS